MMRPDFIRLVDCDLDEPLPLDVVAEAAGSRPSQLMRLVRLGLIETISGEAGQVLLPARSIVRLRRMHRLRRDSAGNVRIRVNVV